MRNIRICKEKGCQDRIPTGKSLISWYCRMLGYCRYCYRMNYPKRRWTLRTEGRKELELPLSREDRIWHAEHAFEGMEQIYWSKDFLAEWREYIEALKRGELKPRVLNGQGLRFRFVIKGRTQ